MLRATMILYRALNVCKVAQLIGTIIKDAVKNTVVSQVINVGGTTIIIAGKCMLNPSKSYVGILVCVVGILVTICSAIPTPATFYCYFKT